MNGTNFIQTVEMTDEEKLRMYLRCTKKELAKMLIEANKQLDLKPRVIQIPVQSETHTNHYDHCSCNLKNGGSGVCQCILGNKFTIDFDAHTPFTLTDGVGTLYPKYD